MKPTPPGWPRISSAVYYDDAARAIDWLCQAFGFEVQIKVEGEGVDAHGQRARAADAKIISEPKTTDYGQEYWADRNYEAEDPEGHHWWFMQRLRNPPVR